MKFTGPQLGRRSVSQEGMGRDSGNAPLSRGAI